MSENASKPNPRFDRSTEIDNDTTSEESVIKAKIKEIEKAMSIDEEDVAVVDSQSLGNKEGFEGSQGQNTNKKGRAFIQFGSFPEQMEVNTATFYITKDFRSKRRLASDQ